MRLTPQLAALVLTASPALAQDFVPRGSLLQPDAPVLDLVRADFDGDGAEEILAVEDVSAQGTRAVRIWDRGPSGPWSSLRVGTIDEFLHPIVEDFDGDGRADVALIADPWITARPTILFGAPAGTPFEQVTLWTGLTFGDNDLAALDLDGDGDKDLVMTDYQLELVLRNDGNRSFAVARLGPGAGAVEALGAHDVDLDGREDLVLPIVDGVGWRRSRGDGSFEPLAALFSDPAIQYSYRFESHDIDGDGESEIVCTDARAFGVPFPARTCYWLDRSPSGAYAARTDHLPAPGTPRKIGDVRDVNLDGIPDVLLSRDNGPLYFTPGTGGGAFGPTVEFAAPGIVSPISVDVDLDGDLDLVSSAGTWFENVVEFGTVVCPGQPNSVGSGATLTGAGSDLVAVDHLTLDAADLPPAAFGLLATSLQPGTPLQPPGTQGLLCLGGSIGRFDRPGEIRQADAAGHWRFTLDLDDVPDAVVGSVAVAAPETRYFQLWYRDSAGGVATSNFTAALAVALR